MSTSASEPASVAGTWFDASSSRGQPALLRRRAGGLELRIGEGDLRHVDPDAVQVSSRIGNIPRHLTFPGGGSFQTRDNDGVDALLGIDPRRGRGLAHWLEARWPIAIAALVAVVLLSIGAVRVGVPWLAERAAERLPDSVASSLGAQLLEVLDGRMLHESRLPRERQSGLQALFDRMTRGVDPQHAYWLELRHAPGLGPNALALPARTVVLTDQLVEMARNDDELAAVIAHELGHLQGRHSLRMLLQSAGVSLVAVALFGDVSSLYAIGTAAPLLLQAKHSRDFEREADAYAREWLARNGVPAERFDEILCRFGADDDAPEVFAYLATHPSVAERARCAPDAR